MSGIVFVDEVLQTMSQHHEKPGSYSCADIVSTSRIRKCSLPGEPDRLITSALLLRYYLCLHLSDASLEKRMRVAILSGMFHPEIYSGGPVLQRRNYKYPRFGHADLPRAIVT